MATKKPKKNKNADPTVGTLRLRGNLKLKYAAAVYASQAAGAKVETLKAQIALKASNDPVFADALELLKTENSLLTEMSKTVGQLHTVAKQICEKFDIPLADFRHFVVNTESGQITRVEKEKK